MLPEKRGRGRPKKDPRERRRGMNVSLPPSVIEGVAAVAVERSSRVSSVVQEFIERGLIEHEIRRRRLEQEVAA